MKVRILQKFHDKANYMTVYLVGETVAFDDARAESLIKRGLVESAEEPIELVSEVEETPAAVVEAEDIIEVSEVEEPTEVEVVESVEVVETPAEETEPEEVQKGVKPVAAKRKNQPKDN